MLLPPGVDHGLLRRQWLCNISMCELAVSFKVKRKDSRLKDYGFFSSAIFGQEYNINTDAH